LGNHGEMQMLIDLENDGWRALSSGAEAARSFYEHVLDRDVVMLLPGGMRIDNRARALDTMSGQPWSSHELQDVAVRSLSDTAAAVVYAVTARRGDAKPYSALITSTYVRRADGWKLALHQQTPG
jgi:hypothetical protein